MNARVNVTTWSGTKKAQFECSKCNFNSITLRSYCDKKMQRLLYMSMLCAYIYIYMQSIANSANHCADEFKPLRAKSEIG